MNEQGVKKKHLKAVQLSTVLADDHAGYCNRQSLIQVNKMLDEFIGANHHTDFLDANRVIEQCQLLKKILTGKR